MRKMNETLDVGMTIEEVSEETDYSHFGEFDIECEYCGSAVYYRPGICLSCGGTVAAAEDNV